VENLKVQGLFWKRKREGIEEGLGGGEKGEG
jgi:hypothetical protein